jgi:dTDP-4-dehydrorhamnose 3,5-epimerase
VAVQLAAGDWTQLVVPPGFAHGFCTLDPDTEVVFRLSDFNEPTLLRGLRWNDPTLAIGWPCGNAPVRLFEIDREWPRLADLPSPF